jgi:phage terminase Nu1 subunit (DNA packaging protein)
MSANSGEKVLTSWKEIASFFGKGVRTVQRWERKFGLPISRPTSAKNVVLTTESELREWIRRSSRLIDEDGSSVLPGTENSIAELTERLKRLETETGRLAQMVSSFAERMDRITEKTSPVTGTESKVVTPVLRRSSSKPGNSSGK